MIKDASWHHNTSEMIAALPDDLRAEVVLTAGRIQRDERISAHYARIVAILRVDNRQDEAAAVLEHAIALSGEAAQMTLGGAA